MEIRSKLNPNNEKDRIIIDVLQGEYSPSDTIRNILYKIGRRGIIGSEMSLVGSFEENKMQDAPINDLKGDWGDNVTNPLNTLKGQEVDDDLLLYFR